MGSVTRGETGAHTVLAVGDATLDGYLVELCDRCDHERVADTAAARERLADGTPDCLVVTAGVDWRGLADATPPVVLLADDDTDAAGAVTDGVTECVRRSDPQAAALLAARVHRVAERPNDRTNRARDQEWLSAVVRHATDSMSVLDRAGRAVYNTPTVEDQLGYTPATLRGSNVFEQIHPEDRDRIRTQFAELVEQPDGTYATATYRRRHADGSWRWIEAVASPQFDDPAIEGVVVNRRDVTEREHRRRRLREQEAYVGSLLDAQPDVFYVVDEQGRLEEWNARLRSVVGYDDDRLRGMDVAELVVPADHDALREALATIRRDETTVESETELLTADGERVHYQLNGAPLTDGNGEVTGVVGTGRDISEHVRREQRLSVLNRVLRHNVRNRTNVVIGHARALRHRLSGDHAERATEVERVGAQLDRLGRLARTVDRALSESTDPSPVDLNDAVRDAVTRLLDDGRHGTQPAADHVGDADLRVADPPAVAVLALDELAAALTELLDNAVRHNDSPEPRVRVRARRDGDRVTVVVADDGPPIPSGEIEALGGPESDLEHGGGLGLWFVEWIVSASGGELSFGESDLGGNRVTVELAVAE